MLSLRFQPSTLISATRVFRAGMATTKTDGAVVRFGAFDVTNQVRD